MLNRPTEGLTTPPRWLQAFVKSGPAPQKSPPESGPLRVNPQRIPLELRHHDAWANWHYQQDRGRWSKPPFQSKSGEPADPGNPDDWSSFDAAWRAYQDHHIPSSGGRPYDGLSFALNYRWGIVGVDLDHVSDHKADAERILDTLHSYSERSPSGDGYRVFVRGTLPEGRRRRDWVEMSTRRFFSVTGQQLSESPDKIASNQAGLYQVWARYVQQ